MASTLEDDDVVASSKATRVAGSANESLFNAKKEIVFGSVAGMVAELFEYPFDLAKVRLQAQLLTPSSAPSTLDFRFDGPLHCLIQTWKEEGIRGLYRGLPVPIVGSMAETATVFVAYTFLQDVIRVVSPSALQCPKTTPLSLSQLGLASAGAGFLTSFILTPLELIKCKMQVQMMNIHPPLSSIHRGRIPDRSTSTILSSAPRVCPNYTGHQSVHAMACSSPVAIQPPKFPGVVELTRSVISADGFRGLWLGHTGTVLRETSGYAAWFVCKEWVARGLLERRLGKVANNNTRLLPWESGLSGAIAGAVGALLCYPADTVKSVIQTEEDLLSTHRTNAETRQRSTFSGTLRRMWVTHGIKGLYAGCGMTVARAVPSSGIIFVVYDGLSAWLS